MDLILLAKITKIETDTRAARVELECGCHEGQDKQGTQIPILLISVINRLERRELAVIRSMSLNQTTHDPRTNNSTAKVESEASAAPKYVGVALLIDQVMN